MLAPDCKHLQVPIKPGSEALAEAYPSPRTCSIYAQACAEAIVSTSYLHIVSVPEGVGVGMGACDTILTQQLCWWHNEHGQKASDLWDENLKCLR